MHIEIQVALNFVISYLYNKLPRRRVNIFGEELEKALKDKFQDHWYPEKPFKGSAFRCLKTGDPTDAVLERAARESGVPIADILENLPNELSVWVDPGEVSYRIGEKGLVKILYSENSDNHEENTSADREVNKTFNPEAQCFRPIDAVNTSMNGLSLSPKSSPHAGSSPHSATSSTSPTYKGSPNPIAINNGSCGGGGGGGGGGGCGSGGSGGGSSGGSNGNGGNSSFLQRTQAPLTFTTATFAQTKFGSTKLKTSSKRANSSSYRMSPTEFSNYIKQRAMQQQLHHGHPGVGPQANHFGPIGPVVSPARSLSPNPLGLGLGQTGAADPFYFPSINSMGMYPQFNAPRNIFDAATVAAAAQSPHFHPDANAAAIFGAGNVATNVVAAGKFNGYLEPHGFYGLGGQQLPHLSPQSMQSNGGGKPNGNNESIGNIKELGSNNNAIAAAITVTVSAANGPTVASMEAATGGSAGALSPAVPSAASANNLNSSGQLVNNATNAAVVAAAAAIASSQQQQQQQQQQDSSAAAIAAANATTTASAVTATATTNNSKFEIDGLNAFYSNNPTGASYQQLLVAN